jgi:hypothetical protein
VRASGPRKATSRTAPGEDLVRRSRTGVRFPAAPQTVGCSRRRREHLATIGSPGNGGADFWFTRRDRACAGQPQRVEQLIGPRYFLAGHWVRTGVTTPATNTLTWPSGEQASGVGPLRPRSCACAGVATSHHVTASSSGLLLRCARSSFLVASGLRVPAGSCCRLQPGSIGTRPRGSDHGGTSPCACGARPARVVSPSRAGVGCRPGGGPSRPGRAPG